MPLPTWMQYERSSGGDPEPSSCKDRVRSSTSGCRHAFDIVGRHRDDAGKSGVLANVIEFSCIGGGCMQQRFDPAAISLRPVLVVVCPDGLLLHDKGLTVGVELVGHRANPCKKVESETGRRDARPLQYTVVWSGVWLAPVVFPFQDFFVARPNPGSLLVVALLGLGLAAAATGIWFQWQQTRRCLGFYGVDNVGRISRAPRVELWLLKKSPSNKHTGRLRASRRLDISAAKGLVHLRRGLVEDANFAWESVAADRGPQPDSTWDIAFVFADDAPAGGGRSLLAIDFGNQPGEAQLTVVGRPGRVTLGKMAKGLRDWVTATLAAAGIPAVPVGPPAG